ncbi:MAG: polyprenyl diphosphate synthase [Patescibacteria group bacterium]
MKIPNHLAIIMDGNRRWAKKEGKEKVTEGHKWGAQSLEDMVEAVAELGIKYFTVYAFSTENFSRSKEELKALFDLCVGFAQTRWQKLRAEGIQVKIYGKLGLFPDYVEKAMIALLEKTQISNPKMVLGLCFGYGGRQEIVECCQNLLRQSNNVRDISEEMFEKNLFSAGIPDIDLVIRTGGAQRISNFMLWKIAYAELYFTDKYWPEFTKNDLFLALEEYENRERRFGK